MTRAEIRRRPPRCVESRESPKPIFAPYRPPQNAGLSGLIDLNERVGEWAQSHQHSCRHRRLARPIVLLGAENILNERFGLLASFENPPTKRIHQQSGRRTQNGPIGTVMVSILSALERIGAAEDEVDNFAGSSYSPAGRTSSIPAQGPP